jgi:ethanolamine utilization protein EutN
LAASHKSQKYLLFIQLKTRPRYLDPHSLPKITTVVAAQIHKTSITHPDLYIMRIGRIIGSVTLSEAHQKMKGGLLRLVVPLRTEDLDNEDGPAEALIAWDELGAGNGQLVAISEGGEAAQPFQPDGKPIDAYISALIDRIDHPNQTDA